MPAGHTEYALPYIFPCPAPAAAFTAQWQAQETSEERPAAMSSNAPARTKDGASPAGLTEDDPAANPSASNTYSSPSAAKSPFSSATHSCSRTCGWIRNTIVGPPFPRTRRAPAASHHESNGAAFARGPVREGGMHAEPSRRRDEPLPAA